MKFRFWSSNALRAQGKLVIQQVHTRSGNDDWEEKYYSIWDIKRKSLVLINNSLENHISSEPKSYPFANIFHPSCLLWLICSGSRVTLSMLQKRTADYTIVWGKLRMWGEARRLRGGRRGYERLAVTYSRVEESIYERVHLIIIVLLDKRLFQRAAWHMQILDRLNRVIQGIHFPIFPIFSIIHFSKS